MSTREQWIQRITFAAETNAVDTHTAWQRDAERHNTFAKRGEGNKLKLILICYQFLKAQIINFLGPTAITNLSNQGNQ